MENREAHQLEREVLVEASEQAVDGGAPDLLVGSYVSRESSDGSGKILLGKVVALDHGAKLATIFYENGHREVLEHCRVAEILMTMDNHTKLTRRKRKLDQLVASGEIRRPNTRSRKNNSMDIPSGASALPCQWAARDCNDHYGEDDEEDSEEDADSYSDSCDYDTNLVSSSSAQLQIVPLPPSSGDINVPEESIPYLFSVYNFLRSFSFQLFLSPFGFDDFVGCLNCTVHNSLLDAIHLSVMRALMRHLQMLLSEDSELAAKCLRYCDWTLLDPLTWPAILVGYLYQMGYLRRLANHRLDLIVSGGEYYCLPAGLKLKVLQILCDEVVNSAEFRTELEMREDMEEADESIARSKDTLDNGPRRVHPRYSKTSACKDLEALKESVESVTPNLISKISALDAHASDAAEDGNSDECRLCGMDGMLICCDGCPSAYHSRCIGLNKAYLPDGSWFCPECTINKFGITSSRIGRGMSGGEIFGTDANGRMFLGTCNYLLITGTSLNSEPFVRYYNSDDVSKVLSAISAAEIASAYASIYRAISEYWKVPIIDRQPEKSKLIFHPLTDRESSLCHSSVTVSCQRNNDPKKHNVDGAASPNGQNMLLHEDNCIKEEACRSPTESVDKVGILNAAAVGNGLCEKRVQEAAERILCPVNDKLVTTEAVTSPAEKSSPTTLVTGFSQQPYSGSIVTDMSCSSQTISADKLVSFENASCGSATKNATGREGTNSFNISTKKDSSAILKADMLRSHINIEKYRVPSHGSSQYPALFKAQAYVNQYINGDVAASAAAKLMVLASAESRASDASNPKKAVAADTLLQMKAFSGASLNFCWPGFDKKLLEIPRERCGWCISCKAATSKKGCLLNLAASNAVKRCARNFSGLRLVKQVESYISVVAAQIAHMEESLRGLVTGPLSDVQYNKQWHKLAREASSCKALKFLLLELEMNIRGIAFSGDWTRLVDEWLIGFSSSASGAGPNGTTKKRGPGGRRYRKQSAGTELENDSSNASWKNVQWWRGGKLSKVISQRGALSSTLVKKAGRQGGTRKIYGIYYPEGSEFPRRSSQLAWRASVIMSMNVSQIALQVRVLDAHIRWKDLIRPEQNPSDAKGSETDAMAFRNAVISDKKITENKIKYALTFSFQKHLPLRITKNILETEKLQDGNEQLWFSESHVPLYLIKEYEEKVGLKLMPSSIMIKSHDLLVSRKRQLKNQRDIFSHLMQRGEKPSRLSCVSCQQDVFLRDSARCNTCKGYCHKDCTITSIVIMVDNLEFLFTCNPCNVKLVAAVSCSKDALNSQLSVKGQNQPCLFQGQNQHQAGLNGLVQSNRHNFAQPIGKTEVSPLIKSSSVGLTTAQKLKSGKQASAYGLKWKRKKEDVSGKNFRMNNILLKGNKNSLPEATVTCFLCKQPYRSDLMYIRCENCPRWFHADALSLAEAQIFDLVGFRCGSCRRRVSPKCPYAKSGNGWAGMENFAPVGTIKNEAVLSKNSNSGHLTSFMSNSRVEDTVRVNDDPHLRSFEKVEPIGEHSLGFKDQLGGHVLSAINQQKLSVRRPPAKHVNVADKAYATGNADIMLMKFTESLQNLPIIGEQIEQARDAKEGLLVDKPFQMSLPEKSSDYVDLDGFPNYGYGAVVPDHTDLDLTEQMNDPGTGMGNNMEFEPQTYFSFTELLASDDQLEGQCGMPMDNSQEWPSVDIETAYLDVLPSISLGAYDMGSGNELGVSTETILNKACHFCRVSEPLPDLVCTICKLCIHSSCSPWEEENDPEWKCGNCRDWK